MNAHYFPEFCLHPFIFVYWFAITQLQHRTSQGCENTQSLAGLTYFYRQAERFNKPISSFACRHEFVSHLKHKPVSQQATKQSTDKANKATKQQAKSQTDQQTDERTIKKDLPTN